ncbi:MAG: GNAT family N-acetyltransferase [Oscillospiraceae bacterium]|nr:GNAT family N-acetyltransferase [Oscillospiraceae bacterium]MBQ8922935.1 GNAT family N-acetyltransferase [Oscillospiraceae bacterium]
MNAEIDLSGVILKTERLILRPWRETDLDDFYEYASVEGVGESAGWVHHQSPDETRTVLAAFIREKKTFAIEHGGKVIGSLGIECYDEAALPELHDMRGRELGFVLSKAYWGKGLMPEAAEAVLEYLFCQVRLDLVVCRHFAENLRSKRVQEKCGFRFYKTSRYQTQYGAVKDDCINLLCKEDYLQAHA